jgi:hypothetical protein
MPKTLTPSLDVWREAKPLNIYFVFRKEIANESCSFLRKDMACTFLQFPNIQISFAPPILYGIEMLSYLLGTGSFSDFDVKVMKVVSLCYGGSCLYIYH